MENEGVKNLFRISMSPTSVARNSVINVTCHVESIITSLLENSLGIFDRQSKSLRDGSITFSNKIGLFLDLNGITEDEKKLFQKLTEIRNLFAHNFDVRNFVNLEEFQKGKEAINFMEKKFSHLLGDYERTESGVSSLFSILCANIENVLNSIHSKFLTKVANESDTYFKIAKLASLEEIINDKSFMAKLVHNVDIFSVEINKKYHELILEKIGDTDGSKLGDIIKGAKF